MTSRNSLRETARCVRATVLKMTAAAQAPHLGSSLSCVDILVCLYSAVARVSPETVNDPNRDRIILSKGHASAALYACLAEHGFLEADTLYTYCADGSALAQHPCRDTVPGIEVSTGSLGHGLGLGAGIALGIRMRQSAARVFVLLSDGECNEGSVWEAAMWAPPQGLGNLTVIVDFNKLQATGSSVEITQLEPLVDKWKAFGWEAIEIDGHDMSELLSVLSQPPNERPRAVIAHTVKGKGIPFMEGDLEWHYRPPSAADLERALACLGVSS